MNHRAPGYERGKQWRGEGNEELCQLRQLIRENCPRGEFGYDVFDIDIVIYDKYNEQGIIHIHILEKKLGNRKLSYHEEKRMVLLDEAFKLLDKSRSDIKYHGYHTVNVPDNIDYRNWGHIEYDGEKISIPKFIEVINHNSNESIEGGWKT